MLSDNDELGHMEEYDDWVALVETFLLSNPRAGPVYISDSLRIPLKDVTRIMLGIARNK